MNEAFEALKAAFVALLGITVAIIAYFGKRTSERVDELMETAVTRDELTAALNRIEQRQRDQHSENRDVNEQARDVLERIEAKIDANEERASRTRHDTNESVHELALQIAVMRKGQ